MSRVPVVHLLLESGVEHASALAAIWDFILNDPGVLDCIREAASQGNDVAVYTLAGPFGVFPVRPSFGVRQAAPSQFSSRPNYILAPSIPDGAAEVRVHLTGRRAATLAVLLHRYWPVHQQADQQKRAG